MINACGVIALPSHSLEDYLGTRVQMASKALFAKALRGAARASAASAASSSSAGHVRNMSMKAGSLVRSSTSGLRCTIFGAYGFVGRYVTALMAGSGTQCIIPYRGDDMEWRHLKVCSN